MCRCMIVMILCSVWLQDAVCGDKGSPSSVIKQHCGATRTPWHSAASESDDEDSRSSMTSAPSGSRSSSSRGAEIDTFIAEQLLGLKAHTAALELALNEHKRRCDSAPDSGAEVRFRPARKEHEEYVSATGSNSKDEERAAGVVARCRCCCKRPNKVGPA